MPAGAAPGAKPLIWTSGSPGWQARGSSYYVVANAWQTEIDWTREEAGWSSPGFVPAADSGWGPATATAQSALPKRALQMPLSAVLSEVRPVRVERVAGTAPGTFDYLYTVSARRRGLACVVLPCCCRPGHPTCSTMGVCLHPRCYSDLRPAARAHTQIHAQFPKNFVGTVKVKALPGAAKKSTLTVQAGEWLAVNPPAPPSPVPPGPPDPFPAACAMADETKAVNLGGCPGGAPINDVTFASYGTPGRCESARFEGWRMSHGCACASARAGVPRGPAARAASAHNQ